MTKFRITVTEIDENGVETMKCSEEYEGFLLLGDIDNGHASASCMHLSITNIADLLASYDTARSAALLMAASLDLKKVLDTFDTVTEGDESNGTDEACDPQRQ